ncbi:hypothetical protein [Brachyspira sp.]|uniref:hypothetical protein n=1 Tax=Brachyspira sp. TaxID=1977261 RepID=UPI003D7CC665
MAAVGGPIRDVTIEGRTFQVDGENEVEMFLGGWTNEVVANGDGSARLIKSPKAGQANKLPLVIDDSRGDEAFIQEIMNRHEFIKISFTDINEHVYAGEMQLVGDAMTNKRTMIKEIDLQGSVQQIS